MGRDKMGIFPYYSLNLKGCHVFAQKFHLSS
jgi:hypothetical protein